MNGNKTGRATLNGVHGHTSASGITYTETASSATITIAGTAFDNLRKIASAMNAVEWTDGDNDAHQVLDEFLLGVFIDNLASPVKEYKGITMGGVRESVDMILQSVDTGFEPDTPEHKARVNALRDEFIKFGVY
ncbi:MAG: hypothetical protein MJ249_05055 [Kiritimatiellae bacterium]|nr:hypothetical protein [Kiritimatiellia bacterium]